MIRSLPVVPTAIVIVAVLTMVGLGIWQLERADEKDAMIGRYEQARASQTPVRFPTNPASLGKALYRPSTVDCDDIVASGATGARSADGRSGWARTATCRIDGGDVLVILGWAENPATVDWQGGIVTGIVAPAGKGAKLVAITPQAGLEPLAMPDPNDLPNNHLAYSVQWFFFAVTALVIYALAVRRRLANRPDAG